MGKIRRRDALTFGELELAFGLRETRLAIDFAARVLGDRVGGWKSNLGSQVAVVGEDVVKGLGVRDGVALHTRGCAAGGMPSARGARKWRVSPKGGSDGRLELGIGAGWMAADYRTSGLPFDPPATRVARLEEAVHILKAYFDPNTEEPISFKGRFYAVQDLEPFPRRQPKLLIAGTRRRMLRLAARQADIVGLEDHQFAERATGEAQINVADSAEQVAIVRAAAGARFEDLELNVFAARTEITDHRSTAVDQLSAQLRLTPEQIDASTSFLLGSVEAIVEQLQQRRERLGISYVVIWDRVMDAFAPVVARLAGR